VLTPISAISLDKEIIMRKIKITKKSALAALNNEIKDEVPHLSIITDEMEYFSLFYDEYAQEEVVRIKQESFSGSEAITVALEAETLSLSDLKDVFYVNPHYSYDPSDVIEQSESWLMDMFAPHTEGDWGFEDIFNVNKSQLIHDLIKVMVMKGKEFIKENPKVLSENGTFFNVKKTFQVVYDTGRWREAKPEDLTVNTVDSRKQQKDIVKSALSKLTAKERLALGV
jgi:hypothetical protein